jgi:hypothetical protein
MSPANKRWLAGMGARLDAPRSIRDAADMTDAEDCARHLRQLASKPDTAEVHAQIHACLEDYRSRHRAQAGALADLAMAVQLADFPGGALADVIRAWLRARLLGGG